MPNSQIIVNPPFPGTDDADPAPGLKRPTDWRSELFLHPGDWIPWVSAAVVGTVFALGMVVVGLHEREKVCHPRALWSQADGAAERRRNGASARSPRDQLSGVVKLACHLHTHTDIWHRVRGSLPHFVAPQAVDQTPYAPSPRVGYFALPEVFLVHVRASPGFSDQLFGLVCRCVSFVRCR